MLPTFLEEKPEKQFRHNPYRTRRGRGERKQQAEKSTEQAQPVAEAKPAEATPPAPQPGSTFFEGNSETSA